jgi:hypothetical protein
MARIHRLPGALCKQGPCECARAASAVEGLLAVCRACEIYMPLASSALRCQAEAGSLAPLSAPGRTGGACVDCGSMS